MLACLVVAQSRKGDNSWLIIEPKFCNILDIRNLNKFFLFFRSYCSDNAVDS